MLKRASPKNTKENTMVIYERSKVMFDICGDNRFEIIETCKNKLIAATNITDCPDEMAVIDSVLYRCWQMGWLPETPEDVLRGAEKIPAEDVAKVVRCKDCRYNDGSRKCLYPDSIIAVPDDDDFCSYGKERGEEPKEN